MFNLSRIMKAAWTIYHRTWSGCRPSTEAGRRKEFAKALRGAWAQARAAVAEALKTPRQKAAERLQLLKAELMRIDARPFGMRVATDRAALQTEIDALAMEVA